ncbi:MAG TPA: penicillin-binding protein 2 [Symbiobacteriaceae bacterium]|nr:penicillin-binding protein 2 [Symbiobacteriaceae bacterium]
MKQTGAVKPHKRAAVLTGMVLVIVAGLAARLASMTLVEQQTFLKEAEEQRTRSLPTYAPRGLIYDRNMESLVTNRPSHSVSIGYPSYKQAEVLQRLSTILAMPLPEIEQLVAQKVARQRYFEPVHLKDDITQEQYAILLERKNELPGVEVQTQPVREYPNKDMAGHILGYVNQVSQDELTQENDEKHIPGELVGRTGLEAFYDDYLRGKPGMRQLEINNYFQPVAEMQAVNPEPGNSIVLTLDAELQRAAERALEWDMWRIRNTIIGDGPWPHAKAGAVVAMDVKTGAILAMASRPSYDPNMFAEGITEAELKRLHDPVLTPEVNRAIQTAYQPGSTWKMMTSAAALEHGVIGMYDKVYCSGVYDKAGNPKDWTPAGHGWVDTVGALLGSCDIYYYEMGYRMGIDNLMETAKEFGFGQKTGIDLGGENAGMLPDEKNRREIWELDRKDPWGIGHTVSASIGQIVNVTPLQLARYVATLGNDGKVMKPYLVEKVIDDKGQTVKEFAPQVVNHINVRPEYLQNILDGMAAVTAPVSGSSDFALYPLGNIRVGGKTGTAEYPPWDDYGFFVALAPIDNPQIAVAAVIEQAGHGGNVAAVPRAVLSSYFKVPLSKYDPANVPDAFPNDMAALRRMFKVVGTGL